MRRAAHFWGSWPPIVIDFDAAVETFFHHARCIGMEGRLDYRLFPTLDRTVQKLLQKSKPHHPVASLGFRHNHYDGWLTDTAAEKGVKSFLPHSISTGI